MARKNWFFAGAFGLAAAILYFASAANYAYPGVGARLMAVWKGLEAAGAADFPLMSLFARLLGSGNLIAPVCGVVSVVAFFHLVSAFVSSRIGETRPASERGNISLAAASAATFVFLTTPAVRAAATHVEPRLFDFAWALLAASLVFPAVRLKRGAAWLFPLALGAMVALGFCDSVVFATLLPLFVALVAHVAVRAGRRPLASVLLFFAASAVTFLAATQAFGLGCADVFRRAGADFGGYTGTYGWVYVTVFAILPFVAAVLAGGRDFRSESSGVPSALFHQAMTFVVVLAVVTPLAPSALMESYGVLPVLSSAFAAASVGYLVAYWWAGRVNTAGVVLGAVFAVALAVVQVRNLLPFDAAAGSFADAVARKVVDDLGARRWLVTDGALDYHLKLAAAEAGKDLNLVCLARDLDRDYLARLTKLVEREGLGGPTNGALRLSLSLGVRPFVQDWLAADASAAKDVAVFGEPDLWRAAGRAPVPEFFFFGADESAAPDWSAWTAFDAVLGAPEGWGSRHGRRAANPAERLRLSLRRHLGFVANSRGVYLQGRGDDAGAFKMYELVLGEIDRDNVCAVFNELALAERGYPPAAARKPDLERLLESFDGDDSRRYPFWRLGAYYGAVCDPGMLARLRQADGGNGSRAAVEKAMRAMAGGELAEARDLLGAQTVSDPRDMQAWSLLAAVTMRQAETATDETERAALLKDLEDRVLPSMERNADGRFDYYLQMTKGFLRLHEGEAGLRQARDALTLAMRMRPDAATLCDMVLGLDISLGDAASAERHARDVLRRNRTAPLANYVMGSLALGQGRSEEAEMYLRRAAEAPLPVIPALNDLAEALRRGKKLDEAERYARRATASAPGLPVAWETLGAVLMDANGSLDEAEACIRKACELSKGVDGREADVRLLVSLVRVQLRRNDLERAKLTVRKVRARLDELSDLERREFEEIAGGLR